MNYILRIKETRVRPHQMTALHGLVALSWLGAGAMTNRLSPHAPWGIILGLLGLLLLTLSLWKNRWLLSHQVNGRLRILEAVILGIFAIYAGIQGWWPAIFAFGILALILVYAYKKEQGGLSSGHITLSELGIQFPGKWGSRKLRWEEVDSLIYRYGIFTLHRRDGRFYQFEVYAPKEDWAQMEPLCREWIERSKQEGVDFQDEP